MFALTAAAALSLLSSLSHAQILPLDQFSNVTTFPNEQTENVTRYLNEAFDLASDPLIYQYFQDQCITQQLYPDLFQFPPGFVEPFSPFDNLFFVGHTFVSAWAYNTTAGLLLIDALDSGDEIDSILLPALARYGFSGEDITDIILTHEHVDHYGGAAHLQTLFSPTIHASAAAWDALAALPADTDPAPPKRDSVLADGDVLTVGDVAVSVTATPGHTAGTISLTFPVRDGGEEHVAGFSGGTGTPEDKEGREEKIRSQEKFAKVAREAGVDVLVSNHQVADHAVFLADLIKHRKKGGRNPFVVGVESFERYMQINGLCSRVVAAREGMDLQV